MLFLALGQTDFAFHSPVLPVQRQGDGRIALPFDGAHQAGNFQLVEEQFSGALGIRRNVSGGRGEGVDERAEEPRLTVFQQHIGIAQLDLAGADAFDLPALEGNTGLEPFLDEIIVEGFLVLGDRAITASLLGIGFVHADTESGEGEYNSVPHPDAGVTRGVTVGQNAPAIASRSHAPGYRSTPSMSSIQQSALVPYSAAQMYALVDDVPRYPEFLPWCVRAEVLAETETTMRARVSVAKGALSYSFTTDNLRRPPEAIELTLVDGPFKRLQGVWRFVDTPLGCKVSLALEFEFANRLLALTLSPLFKAVTGSMVNSFRQRAEALHGRP